MGQRVSDLTPDEVLRAGVGRWVREDIGAWHCACSAGAMGRTHFDAQSCPDCGVRRPEKGKIKATVTDDKPRFQWSATEIVGIGIDNPERVRKTEDGKTVLMPTTMYPIDHGGGGSIGYHPIGDGKPVVIEWEVTTGTLPPKEMSDG